MMIGTHQRNGQSLHRRVFLLLVACVLYGGCRHAVDARSRVQVVLADGHGVMFCQDCTDPLREGSYLPALTPYYNPKDYFVTGELVYGVPNQADQALFNGQEVANRIVVLDRGKVSFAMKVQRAQAARALAVIIIDNARCTDEPHNCVDDVATVNADLTGDTSFLAMDSFSVWRGIDIPSMLISAVDGERLREFMHVTSFDLNGVTEYMSPGE